MLCAAITPYHLPNGYRIEEAGSIEESGKATAAMLPIFPIMLAITLLIIILQVRSISGMVMVFLTSPLGLIGVVPTLIYKEEPPCRILTLSSSPVSHQASDVPRP